MKLRYGVLIFALQGFAWGQDKISVPLSNPGQPVSLKIRLIQSSITVAGGNVSDVTVETSSSPGRARSREKEEAPAGMKRIDINRFGLEIEEKGNVVTIGDSGMSRGNVKITLPSKSSLSIISTGGTISVSGVDGNVEVQTTNGGVTLTNVSGAVVAHALNGGIKAELDRVSPDQPMSFTSLNGKIDVTLPASTKAKLRLKTEWGSVYSDFDMKLEAGSNPVVEDTRSEHGKYRVKMDRSVTATINGGGPEYLFQTMNGPILIHKK